jgi:gluconolactonase
MLRHSLALSLLICSIAPAPAQSQAPAATSVDAAALVQKIQGELNGTYPPEDGKVNPSVPHGQFLHGSITNSPIYPGADNEFSVYVPAQYDPAKPACLLVKLDGLSQYEGTVLDNLIAGKEVPVIIGVGIAAGGIWKDPPGTPARRGVRHNRSYEFDSVNDHFPDFVINELLPAVQKMTCPDGRAIHLSTDGNDHATTGASTGGIGSFTLAWRRPDQFSRIYDAIGTFVSMRGGHEYPALIRKTEPKPIRVFLEDGSKDAWNPLFGSWYDANLNMESALAFAGCDVAHAWGNHGHAGRPGTVIFPDVMRWLWRDYPAPIKAGQSQNSTLRDILPLDNAGWQKIGPEFQGACGLAANAQGEVYLSDAPAATVYRLGPDDKPAVFARGFALAAEEFGPDGTLYGVNPTARKIIALDAQGASHSVASGITGHSILVTHGGVIYVSEPGAHSDMPSRIWQIKPGGKKKVLDEGLLSASGLAFAPDGALFFAAEKTTKWIYSYVVQPDGALAHKQPYYWLHMTDIPNDSGAEEITVDTHGELYVATRMGVQVCDQNGRVRAILPLPSPSGPARSLCFGGEHFDTLYVTDGKHIFKRVLKIPGFPPSATPAPYPSEGGS